MITQEEKEDILDLVSCQSKLLRLIKDTERDEIYEFAINHANVRELIFILESTHVEKKSNLAFEAIKKIGSHEDFFYLTKYTKVEDVVIKMFDLFKENATQKEMLNVSIYGKYPSILAMAYDIAKSNMTHEELYESSKYGKTEEIRVESFNRLVKEGKLTQKEIQHIVDYSLSSDNKSRASDMLEGGCPYIGDMIEKDEEE